MSYSTRLPPLLRELLQTWGWERGLYTLCAALPHGAITGKHLWRCWASLSSSGLQYKLGMAAEGSISFS